MAGTITVGGFAAGLLGGQNIIGPQTMTGTAVVGERIDVTLAQGDNTITVPTGATAVYVTLPAGTVTVRFDVNAADGGLPVGPGGFLVTSFPSSARSVIVNAASPGGAIEATFI